MTAEARVKVARGIETNQGVAKQYALRLQALVQRAVEAYTKAALKDYEQRLQQRVAAGVVTIKDSAAALDAAPTISGLTEAQADLMARAQIAAGLEARRVSWWFVRQLLRVIPRAQRKALERAGVSKSIIRNRWSVPIIRGQFVAPTTAQQIPAFVDWSTNLITKMTSSAISRVQDEIAHGLDQGYSLSRLTARLYQVGGPAMDYERAKRVALDQSCKLNQFIQVENCKALGITEGVWIHVPGMFTSRATHRAMHGQRFSLQTGMYDSEVDDYVFPAQLPYCRCIYRPVLPDEILERPS